MFIIYLCMIFSYHRIMCGNFRNNITDDNIILNKDNCQPIFKSKIQSTFSMTTCKTSTGVYGFCTNFIDCYPHTNLLNMPIKFLKNLVTCTYLDQEQNQLRGMCCGNLSNLLQIPASTLLEIINNRPIKNKPPSLVVHPATIQSVSTVATTITTMIANDSMLSDFNSCGEKNVIRDQERIVGGQNANVGEWPWITALFLKGRQHCGGTLISSQHVLSAAHCVAHMTAWDVQNLIIRLGDYNIKSTSDVTHLERRALKIIRHKGFDSRTLVHFQNKNIFKFNDISIITLDKEVELTKLIRPICLPDATTTYDGSIGIVIGWGSLRESGPQPSVLQEVNVPIWSNIKCRERYGFAAPGGIADHMLCAGQTSRDSCSGDSGGPLMINNGHWVQVGIVSWGIGCGMGQYPGVYTRLTNFLSWIHRNMK